ncbi:hypothetical protein LguiA_007276 [Lonicera macranthoides]
MANPNTTQTGLILTTETVLFIIRRNSNLPHLNPHLGVSLVGMHLMKLREILCRWQSWWQSPMPPVLPLTQWFVRDLQELVGRVLAFELRNLVTAITELPPSIGYLKNLKKLSLCKSSSQSPISRSLFQLRKHQKTTRSLVLAPIWGLTSLTSLDLTDCNLLEGAIPGDLGSLFSLKMLCLGGNSFENLPSLNQLSQLVHLELNRCKMLRELPELPSKLHRLFANECASLRVSADQFAMCKIEYGWFQDCMKLLDYGEREIVASTLLQQIMLQRSHKRYIPIHMRKYVPIHKNFVLPGRVIPEWFCNHTFTGDSVLLKLPRTSTGRVVPPERYSYFVILELKNKVKSRDLSEVVEIDYSRYGLLSHVGLRNDGSTMGFKVELTFMMPGWSRQLIHRTPIFLRNTGQEHTIMPLWAANITSTTKTISKAKLRHV